MENSRSPWFDFILSQKYLSPSSSAFGMLEAEPVNTGIN
jgi:hypothetical protein